VKRLALGQLQAMAWTFGLSARREWLLSGGQDGSLIAWHVDLARLQAKIRADLADAAGEAGATVADGPEGPLAPASPSPTLVPGLVGDAHVRTRAVRAHGNPIYDVAVAGDSELVFTGADEEVRVWREPWASEGGAVVPVAELRIPQLAGHRGALSAVAETNGVAPLDSGRLVACAAGDGNGYLFDVATQQLVSRFAGHTAMLHAVAAVERAGLVATASEDGTCKLWDARAQGGCVQTVPVGELATALAVSECGNWLAIGGARGGKGRLSMCHVASRLVTGGGATASGSSRVQRLQFADNSLVLAGDTAAVEYWTSAGLEHVVSVPCSSPSVFGLCYDPFSGLLGVAGSSEWIDILAMSARSHMLSLNTKCMI
jgi:WD40 repeat protein